MPLLERGKDRSYFASNAACTIRPGLASKTFFTISQPAGRAVDVEFFMAVICIGARGKGGRRHDRGV